MSSTLPSLSPSKVTVAPIPASHLPVLPSKQATLTTPDGYTTDILTQAFQDRVFVLITQVGKIGCLIQAQTSTPLFQSSASLSDDFSPGSGAGVGTEAGFDLPPPSSATTLTHLLGTPPHGFESLYHLYASQVAAIVAADLAQLHQQHAPQRPVVVALALKPLPKPQHPENRDQDGATNHDENDDDDDDEMGDMLGEGERQRFLQIMHKVRECRVW
ncbi:hypothetical protein ACQY0O_006381 [Thecaphora frezii]